MLQNDILFSGFGSGGPTLKLGGATPQEMESKIIMSIANTPTPLLAGDRLYLLDDGGILTCVKFPSGEELYSERLGAGGASRLAYFSSPVAADGKIYCASRSGEVIVVKLGDKFEVLATNKLDGPITATPAIAWNHLFVRTDKSLWCFGEKDGADSAPPAPQASAAKAGAAPSQ